MTLQHSFVENLTVVQLFKKISACCRTEMFINTLRTGDADLRLYVTTVQDG